MKKFFLVLCLLLMVTGTAVLADEATAQQVNSSLKYQAHVSNIGWMDPVSPDATAGTEGQSLALEALKLSYGDGQNYISYKTHVRNVGWTDPVTSNTDTASGTTGQALSVEALQISPSDALAPQVDIYYRVHSANFGWLGWAKNGETAGTTGCAFPVEAVQIIAVSKGAPAPGSVENPSIDISQIRMQVRAHVQNIGWMDPVSGGTVGTTGQGLPIESVEVTVTDPTGQSGAVGEAYVQEVGWQGQQGVNQAVGTTGQGLAIEALRFHLVGPAAEAYDLNYRAHAKNLGWLGTNSNFGIAGTANGLLSLEALDINLVRKGGAVSDPSSFVQIDTPLNIIPTAPTCIVINKAMQRLALYENYKVTLNTNVVTGMQWCDDTKSGNWSILQKVSPYHTVGPGYDAWTNYWLTLYQGDIYGFNGEGHIVDNVGIHDAGWRTNWTSSAYLTDGSHGCVNTPAAAMQYLWDHTVEGLPVIVR